jgi:hypothetical protein
MARTRKKVTWKVDRNQDKPLRPRAYEPDVPLSGDFEEKYQKNLVPGGMFLLKLTMKLCQTQTGYQEPPFPYARESWYTSDSIVGTNGQLAIYAGTVRVEEKTGNGLIRVPRHSFIINGMRCLVTNLALLDPISD